MSTPAKTPGAGLAPVFDAHLNAEFVTHDVDATMATMMNNPHLTHVPVSTGGSGRIFTGNTLSGDGRLTPRLPTCRERLTANAWSMS